MKEHHHRQSVILWRSGFLATSSLHHNLARESCYDAELGHAAAGRVSAMLVERLLHSLRQVYIDHQTLAIAYGLISIGLESAVSVGHSARWTKEMKRRGRFASRVEPPHKS